MDNLDRLLKIMEQGDIIPKLSLRDDEIYDALDQRHLPPFETPWLRAYRQLETMKGGRDDADPRVTRLRELAFLQTDHRWQSPDLAGYISDDFGLIGDALATGYNDSYVNQLLEAYLNRRFPR